MILVPYELCLKSRTNREPVHIYKLSSFEGIYVVALTTLESSCLKDKKCEFETNVQTLTYSSTSAHLANLCSYIKHTEAFTVIRPELLLVLLS